MPEETNPVPSSRVQLRKQSAQERHANQVHAASVLGDLAVPEDAGELFAAMDGASYDPESDRARHEAELASSDIPALKALGRAIKARQALDKGQGMGQGMDAPGMSKSWDVTP